METTRRTRWKTAMHRQEDGTELHQNRTRWPDEHLHNIYNMSMHDVLLADERNICASGRFSR